MSSETLTLILGTLWVLAAACLLWLGSLALTQLRTVRRVSAWALGQRDRDPRDPGVPERMRGLRW